MMLSRVIQTVCVAACAVLLVVAQGEMARGQTPDPVTAPAYTVGTSVNLFAAPGGSTSVDGWLVRLPDGWALDRAVVLRYGSEHVAAEVRRVDAEGRGQYAVVLARAQQGPHEVVLQVQVGQAEGRASWSMVPFTYGPMGYRSVQEGQRTTQPVSVKADPASVRRPSSTDNQALAFAASAPILLRPDRLPRLQGDGDFTVEFWLQTTGLNEVVLTTWSGNENDAYPLEVMIDASGRLRYYCGQQGRHESLTTRAPVADGRWHHIAIVYHAEERRLALLREGRPVDSLRNVALPPATVAHLAVGGRIVPEATDRSPDRSLAYSGVLDELRFWPAARSASAIRSTARRALPDAPDAERVQLRFEEEPPQDLVAAWPDGVQRVPSGLSFEASLRDLRAAVDDAVVELSWNAENPATDAFVIERSVEGKSFEVVGRVRPQAARASGEGRVPRYAFSDDKVRGQVVYYRIRQQFEDGTERVSGTLKIGLGAPNQRDASLIGNFPNPFSETTTIAYEVRATQSLQITIWDLSGQRVKTLVDDTHTPGYYEEAFRAGSLPSGTYFVRLQTPQSMASHRMVLLK